MNKTESCLRIYVSSGGDGRLVLPKQLVKCSDRGEFPSERDAGQNSVKGWSLENRWDYSLKTHGNNSLDLTKIKYKIKEEAYKDIPDMERQLEYGQ